MENIQLTLCSSYHGSIKVSLSSAPESIYHDIPTGKLLVYNDNEYYFYLEGVSVPPTRVYINDEIFNIEMIYASSEKVSFKLKDSNNYFQPFLHSYGAVRIEVEINGQIYTSESIAVMVSNTNINDGIINMVEYIYDNCEKYLYEEHKHSSILTGIKESDIISIEAKIAYLNEIINTYKEAFHFFKINPNSKLEKISKIDSFDKLQTISANTIRHIVTHTDELVSVDYNTGIQYNKKYFQPNKTLVEYNSYSFNTYENQVIVGFLCTLVDEIDNMMEYIQEHSYSQSKIIIKDGYIDSMYQIFSRSIKKINSYIQELTSLKTEFRQMYFYYMKTLRIKGYMVYNTPKFTYAFRSMNVYRHIYNLIYKWFSCGSYDLGKEELLLSFISTSKIYEYFCLIKLLHYLDENSKFNLIESKKLMYSLKNKLFSNTRYNNYFVFSNTTVQLTLYFQPVVYGDSFAENGIGLYRNTKTNSKSGASREGGMFYTPDYILKMDFNDHVEYLIMDAKYSNPFNVKQEQLQELVYKYLFSISTLEPQDVVKGLYIFCGKTSGSDEENVVHDIARKLYKTVNPFAEILVMNGKNTYDTFAPEILFKELNS